MKLEDLSTDLQEKAKACNSPEELLALAKEEGFELSDEVLESISGGMTWSCLNDCGAFCDDDECPNHCWSDYH